MDKELEVLKKTDREVIAKVPVADNIGMDSMFALKRLSRDLRQQIDKGPDRWLWFWKKIILEDDQRYGIMIGMNHGNYRELKHCIESRHTVEIECSGCGKTRKVEDAPPVDFDNVFAEQLIREGWRWTKIKTLNAIGALCPECNNNKDNPEYWEG